ncbi:MAG: tetratricopeptide repeat protein, partial [Candidatus Aminicenantes bacterium]|nr:tetratricopeptide repeat protein [Candidatus Aminicenantes bacterium]
IFSLVLFPGGENNQPESRLTGATGNERLNILVELTKTFSEKDRTKAMSYGKEALELMRSIPDSKNLPEHLNRLFKIAYRHGDYKAVSEYATQSLEIADKTGDKYKYAEALHYLGEANKYLANYDLAIESVSKAKSLFEQLGDASKVAACLNSIGLIYRRLNDYSKALEFVLKAGKIWDKLGDKKNISTVFNNSAIIHRAMGNLDTALEHLNEGLNLCEEMKNLKGATILKSNIASIYSQQGKSGEALVVLKKILAQEEHWGEKKLISVTLLNIGLCYKDQGDFHRALIYFDRAKKLKEEINEYFGIAGILVELGAINRQLGNRKKARQHLSQALELATKIQAPMIVCDANQEFSALFEGLKDYPKALAYYKKFKEVNDTLFNENNSKRIAELQTRFDMERKEKEISLLKKNKQIQQLDLKHQKNLKNSFILVSVLILILAFVIYTRYRFKVKVTRALSESEEKFRTLAEQSVLGIYIIRDHMIKYVNPKLLSIFGYSAGEVIRQNPSMLAAAEDRTFLIERLDRRMKGGPDSGSYQFRGITKKKEIISLESFGAKTHYLGQPAVLETVIDITERKKTEEELVQYREHLAELVEERTCELKQAQAELDRKERLSALGQLTATVAHEIRNPLGAVRSTIFSLEKAIEKNNMTRVKRAIELAERNVVRCDKIINDLLNFTRQRQLKPEPTKIDPWLETVLNEHTIPESITCIKELSAGIEISFDRELLLRAFTNVVDNAIFALQDKKPPGNRLTLSTLVVDHRLEIRVSDAGVGIPETILGKIFEPLFSTKTFGFGLGLPMVKNILEEHGGGVDIRSQAGRGTTAVLWLPIK